MSITSEIGRINTALDAVEDGKEAIADALTAKGVDTMPDASFDTLATNVGLIESGGGGGDGGNIQKTLLLRTTINSNQYGYSLSTPLSTNGLFMIWIVLKLTASASANVAINCGFAKDPVGNSAQQQQMIIGCRSGQTNHLCYAIVPSKYLTVGVSHIAGETGYNMQNNVCYSRKQDDGCTYFVLQSGKDLSAIAGADIEIYAFNEI